MRRFINDNSAFFITQNIDALLPLFLLPWESLRKQNARWGKKKEPMLIKQLKAQVRLLSPPSPRKLTAPGRHQDSNARHSRI